jgi:hypothetical protein
LRKKIRKEKRARNEGGRKVWIKEMENISKMC